jgi:hypothetical protein
VRTFLRALAFIYIAYLALAILVVMPALNFLPSWYMQRTFDRQLHTDIILFNPFTLTLEVRKAKLPEHNGERFATLDKAAVNLSLESLWQEGWVFDALRVKELYLHVQRLPGGDFNFSDMLTASPQENPTAATDDTIPGVTVHDFDFHSEAIVISDDSREKPYSSQWRGLAIKVVDLSTVLEEGRPYRIDVHGEAGGSLHWEGQVSVPSAHSEGRLQLTNLRLQSIWRFIEPWVEFRLNDGGLYGEATYSLDWQDDFNFQVGDGQFRLEDMDIEPQDAEKLPDTRIKLGNFSIADIEIDSRTQHASIDAITVDKLAVSGWSEGDRVSLAELFVMDFPSDPNAPPEPDTADTDSAWSAAINAIRLRGSAVNWRSEFTDPPLLQVTPLEVTVENVNWPLSGDSPMSLDLTINEDTHLNIDGSLALAEGNGSLNYQLLGLPVPWVNPNLPEKLHAVITDGQVNITGEVALAGFSPSTMQLDGDISNFAGQMTDTEESLTNWEKVSWHQLRIDVDKRSVSLEKLALNNYAGRLHIRKDGSINAQNIWVDEVGEEAEELAEDLSLDEPWAVSIPRIVVNNSEIDFMDESLPIKFRTVIGQLNGEILGISTDPGSQTQVDIRGSVDGYAPVTLQGTAKPFREPPDLDLDLSFDGVDLALLTPYSGTYAGYAIDRGLLKLDLKYTLADSQLEGHNSVVIDQLRLGDKVESDKAADLPLELAVALMTDSNGVIDIQVPVSGNIDDPSFDIGGVVTKAFFNLITKAVTAPFTLLANLVGSEEDLQRLSFKTGSAALDEASKTKLDQLNMALTERPALKLVIAGRLNLKADRERLQQLALRQQMLDEGLPAEAIDSRSEKWEASVEKRFAALPPAGGDAPEPNTAQQYDAIVANVNVPDGDLLELAEARSVAVKSYLVNERQLGASRAAIEQTQLDNDKHNFSGVELSLGN